MFCKYITTSSPDKVQILNDLKLIYTGETDVNNLSASCNKSSTELITTTAAGWTVHDADPFSDGKVVVLKAPVADDATEFKYVVLDFRTAATSFYIQVWKDWDATTHTGTDLAYGGKTPTYNQRVLNNINVPTTFWMFSSARYLLSITEYGTIYAPQAGIGATGCLERSRDLPFDTVARGISPYFWTNLGLIFTTDYLGYAPEMVDSSDTLATGGVNGVVGLFYKFGSIGIDNDIAIPSGSSQKILDASGNQVVPFYPIYALNYAKMPAPYGEISSLCDIWLIPRLLYSHKDVITKGGIEYICMRQNTNTGYVVAFPKQ